jgi:hypothetical protein
MGRGAHQRSDIGLVRIEFDRCSFLAEVNFCIGDARNLSQRLRDRDRTEFAGHVLNIEDDGLRTAGQSGKRCAKQCDDEMIKLRIFVSLSVEQRCGPRDRQQAEQQGCYDPEGHALPRCRLGVGTLHARCAGLWHEIELAIGQTQEQKRQPDEDGTLRCQSRKVTDPGPADAEGQQDKRSHTADRSTDGG